MGRAWTDYLTLKRPGRVAVDADARFRSPRRSHTDARLSVTMDIYSHLMPNMQADALARARVDDVLQNAMLRRSAGEGTENKR